MTHLQELAAAGQSVWLDFIERNMVRSGDLARLVEEGLGGVTSNPTIFQQAISKSDAYTADLEQAAARLGDAKSIFETLAVADIQAAADVLRPVYDARGGHDGFVSLEVAPDLAYDTEATVAEALRLHGMVARPNLMVKVPATLPGIDAIRRLIAAGLNINVTLIFSLERYAAVKEAFIQGLEERFAAGQPIDRSASVASFFVSRVDTNVDARLEKIAAARPADAERARALLGKAAVANAKLAYRQFQQKFAGPRWERLAAAGARVQRPLWASTSTKNPAYPTLMYVEPLIGPHTVNTMPPQTLDAVRQQVVIERTVDRDVEAEVENLARLAALGIDMTEVTDELEQEGVAKFADSFGDLLGAIEKRRAELSVA
jgi:transaldolase